ncbi:fMet-Leu-Phe receptor-like [Pristis pectinata]|uniref:fMet-Leu-Phe receptor-like n=1 Tax=Pristis pectinata TaxID=685728 RepID=UPI00223DB8D7|nr:fMet-Leu-Phe receptor-like [Pristis pectinata]
MSLSEDLSNSTLCGNFSNYSTHGNLRIHWSASTILAMIVHALTFLLGVPGNCAAIWVMGFKMKYSGSSVLFLNLAVADLTYCLTLPFRMAKFALPGSWLRSYIASILIRSATILTVSASVFLLTLISIHRCLAVTHPIWFQQQSSLAWVLAACFAVWGLALLASLPELLIEHISLYFGHKTLAVLQVLWTVFIFALPIMIMAACYLLIVRYVTISLSSFNSALNPLLYVFAGQDFRQVFRRSLAASLRLAFVEEGPELGSDLPDPNVTSDTSVSAIPLRSISRTILSHGGEN